MFGDEKVTPLVERPILAQAGGEIIVYAVEMSLDVDSRASIE